MQEGDIDDCATVTVQLHSSRSMMGQSCIGVLCPIIKGKVCVSVVKGACRWYGGVFFLFYKVVEM